MKTLVCLTALLIGVGGRSAVAQLVWNQGEATLSTGMVVRGELCFQPDLNMLLIRTGSIWRTYSANQLQNFQFVDQVSSAYHHFTVYSVPKNGQEEAVPLLFEELTLGAPVRLLQLPGSRAWRIGKKFDLPMLPDGQWQTPQPWYVWIDGRLVAPDVFVKTELSDLITNSPEAVKQWAKTKPRPRDPEALAYWLTCYYGQLGLAERSNSPTFVTWQKPK